MLRLWMAGLLLVSFNAVAATQVTHKSEDGDIIEAEKFNKNFDDLEAAIDNIPAGPPGPQGAQGSAGADGPAGADGVAAGLSCTTDQSIVYRGGAWVCSSPQLVTQVVLSTSGEAVCPSGKRVTGGGCLTDAECYISESRPDSSLTEYVCSTIDTGNGCRIETAYAICQ